MHVSTNRRRAPGDGDVGVEARLRIRYRRLLRNPNTAYAYPNTSYGYSNTAYARNPGYQQQSRNNQYWNSARRDADRDGIPNRYDRDANGDGVPDRYQGRYN